MSNLPISQDFFYRVWPSTSLYMERDVHLNQQKTNQDLSNILHSRGMLLF
jgi:hypothetical protein